MTKNLSYKEGLKQFEITSTKKGADTAFNGGKYENGIAHILNMGPIDKSDEERWKVIKKFITIRGFDPEKVISISAKRIVGTQKEDVIVTLYFKDKTSADIKISVKGISGETQFGLTRGNVFLDKIDCPLAKKGVMQFLGEISTLQEIKLLTGKDDKIRLFKNEIERRLKHAMVDFFNSYKGIEMGLDVIFGTKEDGVDIIVAPKKKWCYDLDQLIIIDAKRLRRRMETLFKPEYKNFVEHVGKCIKPDDIEKIIEQKPDKNGKLMTPDSEGKLVLANLLSLKRRGGSSDTESSIKGSDAQFNCSVKALYELSKILSFLEENID